MIDAAILEMLKRKAVSTDKEKTKERIEALWKSLKSSEKKAFYTETGEHENNIIRFRKEGAITPKPALLIANYFNIDPSYITGDVDENAGWSDEAMIVFLESKGYTMPVQEVKKTKRPYKKRKPVEEAVAETIVEEAVEADIDDTPPIIEVAEPVPAPIEEPVIVAAEPEAPTIEIPFDNAADMPIDEMLAVITTQYTLAKYSAVAKNKLARIAEVLIS